MHVIFIHSYHTFIQWWRDKAFLIVFSGLNRLHAVELITELSDRSFEHGEKIQDDVGKYSKAKRKSSRREWKKEIGKN